MKMFQHNSDHVTLVLKTRGQSPISLRVKAQVYTMTYHDFHSDLTLRFLSNLYLLNSPHAHSAPGTQTSQLNIKHTRYAPSFRPVLQLSARSPSFPIYRMIHSIIAFKPLFICHPLNESTMILLNIDTPLSITSISNSLYLVLLCLFSSIALFTF